MAVIVASHQPNFIPNMGYFYKMDCATLFTISDHCTFSRSEYINFNYVSMNGKRMKLTVPVSSHSKPINETELADWDKNKKKIWNTLQTCYGKHEYFKLYKDDLKQIIMGDYKYISELNLSLIKFIRSKFKIDTPIIKESDLFSKKKSPTEEIKDICYLTQADYYLSGKGAQSYLKSDDIKPYKLIWSNYVPCTEEYSALHYLFVYGPNAMKKYDKEREALLHGI